VAIPGFLATALGKAAASLGRSLDRLDYPNSNRGDAPFTEANVIAHFAAALVQVDPDADFYLEAAHVQGQRIDMIAHSQATTLVVEAKVFGDPARCSASLLGQLDRMPIFRPACWDRVDEVPAGRWWSQAREAWQLVLIASHAGITPAWKESGAAEALAALYPDETAPPRSLHRYGRQRQALTELLAKLDGWTLDHEEVLKKGIFKDTSVDLLWAARRSTRAA
jgi:hypothetical protein